MHQNDNSLFIWLYGIYIVSNLVASGIYESLSAGFLINGLAILFLVVLASDINSSLSLLKREIINYKASEHTEKDLKNIRTIPYQIVLYAVIVCRIFNLYPLKLYFV